MCGTGMENQRQSEQVPRTNSGCETDIICSADRELGRTGAELEWRFYIWKRKL